MNQINIDLQILILKYKKEKDIDYNEFHNEIKSIIKKEVSNTILTYLKEENIKDRNNKYHALHYKLNYMMIKDCTKYLLDENIIEIKKSDIHGKGVFSKNTISINKIITIYPANYIKYCSDKVVEGRFIGLKDCDDDTMKKYGFVINDYITIIGDPNNTNITECAHLINHSTNKYNCVLKFIGELICAISCKDIKEGEEIITNYGYNYEYDF